MFAQSLAQVRRHPGRFLSTLLAIAISVAFLSGSAIMVDTEGAAQAYNSNRPLSKADVVVTDAAEGAALKILAVDGVAEVAPVLRATLLITGANGISQGVNLVNVMPQSLRWAELSAGSWPSQTNELVLTRATATSLGLKLGEAITVPGNDIRLKLVGITDEPGSTFLKAGYAADALFNDTGVATSYVIKATPGTDTTTLVTAIRTALAGSSPDATVRSAADAKAQAVTQATGDIAAFTYLLWAFAAVALVVGMITIANTFTITLAQRRRQIGLLRAIGASGAQVRRRFLSEALLLGVIGSVLGIALGTGLATIAAAWTGSLYWGLSFPWPQLAIAFGLGVLATLGAAWVPILKGTRVLPLEALQPVPDQADQRRASIIRSVVCGLLLAGGAAAAVMAFQVGDLAFPVAIGAGLLIALGVLLGAPLFVPSLLRVIGHLFRWTSPVASLAADNAERNPRRAAATASALMLAVGLMVTLQVATASIRATTLDQLAQNYPVDVTVDWIGSNGQQAALPTEQQHRLANISGVDRTVVLKAATAEIASRTVLLIGYDPAATLVTGVQATVGDDQILVTEYQAKELGTQVTVKGSGGSRKLTTVVSSLASEDKALVSRTTLAAITKPVASVMWLSVPDRSQAISVSAAVAAIAVAPAVADGSIIQAAVYEQVLNILLMITTALLGVAVLIALIGVSNTLGLSVLERTRESALLRALGLQARSLRAMLTIEALQVTVVGIGVGVLAGAFFGWLAVATMARSAGLGTIRFAVDVPQTLAMIAIAMAAAALASVLPGRRAAKAAPTQALADI